MPYSEVFPICISQFEEKFDEVNGADDSTNFPVASSSGPHDNIAVETSSLAHDPPHTEAQIQDSHELNPLYASSQDYAGGMTKITPSNIDVSVVFPSAFIYLAFRKFTSRFLLEIYLSTLTNTE